VLVDGRRVNSCLTLAVMKDGAAVMTIEGLATNGVLHPLQQASCDTRDSQACQLRIAIRIRCQWLGGISPGSWRGYRWRCPAGWVRGRPPH
jgi:hypothetical protein